MLTDQQTVAADFDCFSCDRLRARQDAELDFEMRDFFVGDGREAIVVKGGGASGFRHSPVKRAGRQHVADASSKFSAQIERRENAAELREKFGEMSGPVIQRNFAMLEC